MTEFVVDSRKANWPVESQSRCAVGMPDSRDAADRSSGWEHQLRILEEEGS